MYNQVLMEKNDLLAQELEQCRTQLTDATTQLEKFKKASSGNISLHQETKNYTPAVLQLLLVS